MSLSIEANLRWTRDFLAAEWRLVLPVALAFLALPPLVLTLAVPVRLAAVPQTLADLQAIGQALPPWFAPLALAAALLTMAGALALAALALVPRISVGEAIALAARRIAIYVVAVLLIAMVAFVALVAGGTALVLIGLPQQLVMALMLAALVATAVFVALLIPPAVDRRGGPQALVRAAWQVYRRGFAGIAGASALVFAVSWVSSFALQVALGSLILTAGLAAAQPEAARALASLLSAVLGALQWSFFYIFVAALYRSRAGASRAI